MGQDQDALRPAAARLAALAAGWTVMTLQLLGGRLMAPAFGQTIHQWGALIGVTLAFMTLGYWAGGQWGRRPRAGRLLPVLLGLSAGWAALTPWLGRAASLQAEALLGPLGGALAAACVLLGPPAFALAAVSPLCVALLARRFPAGPAAGAVSALGAMGSIGGTFFGAFLAVPYLGLVGGYASAAVAAGLAALATGMPWRAGAALAVLLVPGVLADRAARAGFIEVRETPYNTIYVFATPGATVLSTNATHVVQTLRRHDGGPTGQYWDWLGAVPALAETAGSALFLGVAGGAAVEAGLRGFPGLRAEGVEIDPGIIEVARRHFGLAIPVAAADARRFLAEGTAKFDVIVIDLYATGQIPAHVATREFYAEVARRLAPGGVVALNVFGAGAPELVLPPIAATLGDVFATVLAADAGDGNTILLAWAEAVDLATARARLAAAPAGAQPAAGELAAALAVPDAGWAGAGVLSDDRSDLDLRAARALGALRRRVSD
jgi:SAM-dependent methyltransferase